MKTAGLIIAEKPFLVINVFLSHVHSSKNLIDLSLLAGCSLEVLPAVDNNGSGVRRIDSLDLLEEFQHADG